MVEVFNLMCVIAISLEFPTCVEAFNGGGNWSSFPRLLARLRTPMKLCGGKL